ncbi:MAG TPA: family 1 glycosylhydrolase [Anaerolineales bacterium]|nr:family 1 glycosylhydrolase [Anaerolineales bacterium]
MPNLPLQTKITGYIPSALIKEMDMAQANLMFPRGFLWGSATASHQVEGQNTNNNWWAWEQQAGRIINGDKSGMACDWWGGRWREDFDRAAEAHQNAHRLSIEWSRVQPAPDRWDESALDNYREMLQGLTERGMTPMITLHHFSDPIWLTERGGWESPDSAVLFNRYVEKTVEALSEYVNLWITINEPNTLLVSAFLFGSFPPGKQDRGSAIRAAENFARAHVLAYHTIHRLQVQARVGIALNYRSLVPARSWSPLDHWAANTYRGLFNDLFPDAFQTGRLRIPFHSLHIPQAKGTQDFLGINYYTRDQVKFNILKPDDLFANRSFLPDAELSPTGFISNVPEGMFEALKWGMKFNLPMIVTENGVEDADDHLRPRYLIQHLHQVWRAVNFNFPVKGYFHWSLVDNFEWERGWTQRFGLWELDIETQARRKRSSADLYSEICRTNALSSDLVARYAPEVLPLLFAD